MPDRRVLVIAYYFPPWGGGPVLRTLKLVKYLQPLGWELSVLTAEPRYYESVSSDPQLLNELGSATVVRTRSLQPTGSLAQDLIAESVGGLSKKRSLARAIMPAARLAHNFLTPDDKILWIPHALAAGTRVARQRRPDIIYVTTPPHSSGLLGVLLSRIARVPLVVDIRDDWIGNPLYRRRWLVRSAAEALMERTVLQSAAAVLVPTTGSCLSLTNRYPRLSERMHIVPNGFDDEDIAHAASMELDSAQIDDRRSVECVYTGLITARRSLTPLFAAMQRVNQRFPSAVRLRIAGFLPTRARDALTAFGLRTDVVELGYVPHLRALRLILDSDVALLISTEGEGARTAVPSKLYEYVACGKPVLGLVDPGAARDLIEYNNWGATCPPDDADAIERALLHMLDQKAVGGPCLTAHAKEQVASYSRRSLAGVTSRIMEAALSV